MKWIRVAGVVLAAIVVAAVNADAESGGEGCGEVQNWRWTGLLGTFYGHAFGEDVSPLGWKKEGAAEPNHDNSHYEFMGGGYHNHTDHPTPCGGNN
jgi:hypothetical protein